ncbi:TPA: hypothetical protein TVK06_001197 [Streptococcus equi subsp. zooepidemicus]|nr:hypothetical protein [Streptococcus equi subsp. zooepidemicus]HEL1155947.1 hypothetical protein [Streptococcus equi subsp. zooepidemicus]
MNENEEPNYLTSDRSLLNREMRRKMVSKCQRESNSLEKRKQEILERFGFNSEEPETRANDTESKESFTR